MTTSLTEYNSNSNKGDNESCIVESLSLLESFEKNATTPAVVDTEAHSDDAASDGRHEDDAVTSGAAPASEQIDDEVSSSHRAPYEIGATAVLSDELLAWIFLFVRGHPASGSLSDSRLVCKRWCEVIDDSLSLEKPREPHVTAYRLGYLSPHGLMPRVVNPFTLYNALILRAASANLTRLYLWACNAAMVLSKSVQLRDAERRILKSRTLDVGLRVASGAWDGLTREELQSHLQRIHFRDLPRAARSGVAGCQARCRALLANWGNEAQFEDWTMDEIRRELGSFTFLQPGAENGWKWLIARGVVTETIVAQALHSWLRKIDNVPHDEWRAVVDIYMQTIEEQGWYRAFSREMLADALATKQYRLIMQISRHIQPLAATQFPLRFLLDAADDSEGRALIAFLSRRGVDIPEDVRSRCYLVQFGRAALTEAEGKGARHDKKAFKYDSELLSVIERMVAIKLEPSKDTFLTLARIYRSRALAPHSPLTYAGIRLRQIDIIPTEMAPMRCLILLAEAFPTSVLTTTPHITKILAEVGIASVVTAHRAGYPLHARLEEIFKACGNTTGVAWARRVVTGNWVRGSDCGIEHDSLRYHQVGPIDPV